MYRLYCINYLLAYQNSFASTKEISYFKRKLLTINRYWPVINFKVTLVENTAEDFEHGGWMAFNSFNLFSKKYVVLFNVCHLSETGVGHT